HPTPPHPTHPSECVINVRTWAAPCSRIRPRGADCRECRTPVRMIDERVAVAPHSDLESRSISTDDRKERR
ncbi:MAG TPA: hypothetical protein VMS92_22275, partial [Mycobacterium sp.]|nr:hypothetical protein [Mycobacterium sp.]